MSNARGARPPLGCVTCGPCDPGAADMGTCLRTILDDGRVSVVEVKNRLAADYDDAASCGYRDIQLKVTVNSGCFDREESGLGLHEHVCEVQLHLKPVYALKNDEGQVLAQAVRPVPQPPRRVSEAASRGSGRKRRFVCEGVVGPSNSR